MLQYLLALDALTKDDPCALAGMFAAQATNCTACPTLEEFTPRQAAAPL